MPVLDYGKDMTFGGFEIRKIRENFEKGDAC